MHATIYIYGKTNEKDDEENNNFATQQNGKSVKMTEPSKMLTNGSEWIKTTSSSGSSKLKEVYKKQNIYIWKHKH